MRTVGLRVLKNRLSEYVRSAASGEAVLVTDRGRVVAELVPPRGDLGGPLADELLADAIRQGWLTPRRSPGDRALPRRPVAPLARLLAELAADRSDR